MARRAQRAPVEYPDRPSPRRAHAVFLFGLPAQQLDQGEPRHARRRRNRLSRNGVADGSGSGRRHRRGHPDGRRGRAVARHGTVRTRGPLRAEHRRRHVHTFGISRPPRCGRLGREHHLQAALQRHRRDDRRTRPRRRVQSRSVDASACRGRGVAHRRHLRRPVAHTFRRPRRRRRGA